MPDVENTRRPMAGKSKRRQHSFKLQKENHTPKTLFSKCVPVWAEVTGAWQKYLWSKDTCYKAVVILVIN